MKNSNSQKICKKTPKMLQIGKVKLPIAKFRQKKFHSKNTFFGPIFGHFLKKNVIFAKICKKTKKPKALPTKVSIVLKTVLDIVFNIINNF